MPPGYLAGKMETATIGFTDLVQDELAQVEGRMRAAPDQRHPELSLALNQLLTSGGKRVRPTLVLLAGGLLGAEVDRLVTLAGAIELLHTATLVHDDLIDGSLMRRGLPTLNATWDGGATVLTGDYIFARAAHLAAQTGSLSIMESFSHTLMEIVNGELTQLFGSSSGDRRKDYFDRVYAKTGSLFELATEGAALLAEASGSTLEAMKAFGCNLGIAFQIVDDVLDFIADSREVGKPVASDLRHGLITLPTLLHLETYPDDHDRVQLMIQKELPESEAMNLIVDIRHSGAVEGAMQEAAGYVQSCEDLLKSIPAANPGYLAPLHELAAYIVKRTV